MQASEIQIRNFLAKDGTKFIIPVYQRNYDWRRRQCQQLLDDLKAISGSNNAYFIGSIVHQSTRNLTNNTELIIIDGQQRITTLTLLLYVLSQKFREFGEDLYAEQIETSYLFNRFDSNKNKLKLKPVNEDDQALQNLIQGNKEQIPNGHRIRENYEFFASQIESLVDAKLYYESFPKLTIVEISLDDRDDPQKIFQSLNSTGLELSQADLIRNYILMNLDYEDQEKFYLKYWSVIEKNCRNINTFDSELSMFMRDFLTYSYKKIPSKANVYDAFVEKNPDLNKNLDKLESLLGKISRFSKYNSYLINNNSNFSDEVKLEIKNLNKLEVSVAYPFLIGVIDDVENNLITEKELLEILRLIQSFVVRRFICDLPSNALQKIFMSLYANSKKLLDRNPENGFVKATEAVLLRLSSYQRFPTDADVEINLRTKDIYGSQSRKRNYLLENLENKFNSFTERFVDLDNRDDITIEHIFPQNPGKDYKDKLGEQQFEEMRKLANIIGNLTFVINNASLGNRPFLDKRDLNKENSKGFKYSKFSLNESLIDLTEWNLDALEQRTELLTMKIKNVWSYPNVDIDGYALDGEFISIENVEDPTGTQPKSVSVNDSNKNVNSNREMYVFVIEYIYQREPEVFFKPKVRESLNISESPENTRTQQKLEDIYFDTGLSARSIYSRIKLVLENVQEDYEILLQLKNDDDN